LTQGMQANLVALQNIQRLTNQTQQALATGKSVNSALDNPVSFFAALSHTNAANDLSQLKDAMNEAIQTVQAANSGVTGIITLINSAKSLANAALSTTDTTARANYATQFSSLLTQIDNMAADSGYNGTNLLSATTLTVTFNADGTSTLGVSGFDSSSAGLGVNGPVGSWASNTNINTSITQLNTALSTLRTKSQSLSSNVNIIQARLDYTTSMMNVLVTGANNLTLADTNQEGANMLALQTRNQLATVSLSLASQAAQSVLRLFA